MGIMRSTALAVGLAVVTGGTLVACGEDDTGALGEAEYAYCVNEASATELAAAAAALNLQIDADDFTGDQFDPTDPAYVQVCEHAYAARGRDLDAPPGQPGEPGGPLDASPTAPLNPQASFDALPTPLRSTEP